MYCMTVAYDHSPSYRFKAGTEHVGFSPTRKALLAPPSAKHHRGVFRRVAHTTGEREGLGAQLLHTSAHFDHGLFIPFERRGRRGHVVALCLPIRRWPDVFYYVEGRSP